MAKELIPQGCIEQQIFLIRGQKVMLDRDLAALYEVTTGNLNKAVKRNIERFPEDFMFQLTKEEEHPLRFQFGSLKRGQHSKYLPYAFTQEGVAMLSSVLNSRRAIMVNIQIMRVFVKFRRMILTNVNLRRKIEELEKKCEGRFLIVFKALNELMAKPEAPKRRIGFHAD